MKRTFHNPEKYASSTLRHVGPAHRSRIGSSIILRSYRLGTLPFGSHNATWRRIREGRYVPSNPVCIIRYGIGTGKTKQPSNGKEGRHVEPSRSARHNATWRPIRPEDERTGFRAGGAQDGRGVVWAHHVESYTPEPVARAVTRRGFIDNSQSPGRASLAGRRGPSPSGSGRQPPQSPGLSVGSPRRHVDASRIPGMFVPDSCPSRPGSPRGASLRFRGASFADRFANHPPGHSGMESAGASNPAVRLADSTWRADPRRVSAAVVPACRSASPRGVVATIPPGG